MKTIGAIVAATYDGVIGYDGSIPWHCPEDLKRFKEITTGSVVIMGRKTYDSIGRCLPNRINMVVSSRSVDYWLAHEAGKNDPISKNLVIPDTLIKLLPEVYPSVSKALETAQSKYPDKDVWFIGGSEIYKEAVRLNVLNKIEYSLVRGKREFPDRTKITHIPFVLTQLFDSKHFVLTSNINVGGVAKWNEGGTDPVNFLTYEKYQTCQLNSGFVKVTVYSTRSEQLHMGDLVQDSSGNKWIVVKTPRGGLFLPDDELRAFDYDFDLYVEKDTRPLISDQPSIAKPDPMPFRLVTPRFRKYEEKS